MKKYIYSFCLILIAITGAVLVVISTRWGSILSDDSYYYIEPARAALAGKAFSPSPIFGPLLPAVLLLLGKLGIEPLQGIRWLHVVLFSLTILQAGWIVSKLGAHPVFALLAAGIVALTDNGIETFATGMSDALFIFLEFSVILLSIYFFTDRHRYWLVGAGLTAGLACLARFAAFPVVVAGLVVLFIFDTAQSRISRLTNSIIFGVLSLMPFAAYLIRNQLILGRPLFYPGYETSAFTLNELIWYSYNTLDWFVPGRFLHGRELLAGLIFLIAMIAISFWGYIHKQAGEQRSSAWKPGFILMMSIILFTYIMLFFARGLTWLYVYNPRYLVPPLLIFWMIAALVLDILWRQYESTRKRFVLQPLLIILCLGFLAYYGVRAYQAVEIMYTQGLGYLNSGWQQSETVEYIRQHPDLTLVSTGQVGIYFWTGRLPMGISQFTNLAEMHQYICQNKAALFIMGQMPTDIYHMDHDNVVQGLKLVKEFNDSQMYQCP